MFDDDETGEGEAKGQGKKKVGPEQRAREKADELRLYAQIAAVFEGTRKFDARVDPGLSGDVARELQRAVGKLAKQKTPESPVLPEAAKVDADAALGTYAAKGLSTNDYHVYRRPGEAMIARWLAGEQVETFYMRLQAHFDAGLEAHRADEREASGWKGEAGTAAYLAAMEKVDLKLAELYLREPIRKLGVYVLSDMAFDEIDILYLTEQVMGIAPADLVGEASAPPAEGATEAERAWFFKLFALRGMRDGAEAMCFFTYMQKTDESGW
jgi:hypothetical protein